MSMRSKERRARLLDALNAGEIDVDGLIDGLLSRPLKAERV